MSGMLVTVAVKGSLLLAFAFAATRMMARAPAASRSALWAAALSAVALLPAFEAAVPAWRLPVLPAPAPISASQEEAMGASGGSPTGPEDGSEPGPGAIDRWGPIGGVGPASASRGRFDGDAFPRTGGGRAPRAWEWQDLVLLTWFAGFAWTLSRLLVRHRRLLTLLDRGVVDADGAIAHLVHRWAREIGIARPPRVALGATHVVPFVWGIFRPVVVLPRTALGWPDAWIRAAVLHELAHIKRRDVATTTIGVVACAVHWFNPLAWLAMRRMRAEQELACDDLALGHDTRPADYAASLVAIARMFRNPTSVSPLAASVVRSGSLNDRVQAILDAGRRRDGLTRRRHAALVGAVLVATGVLAAGTPAPKRATSPPPVSERDADPTRPSASFAYNAPLPPCWREDGPRSLSVNVNSDLNRLRIERSDDECEGRILLSGPLRFDMAFTRTLAAGAAGDSLVLEERTADARQRVRVVADGRGGVEVDHWRNGERSDSAAARRFLDSRATTFAHYTWALTGPYLDSLLAAGGTDAVIEAIDAMPPDRVAARYVDELLDRAALSDDEMRRLLRIIRRGITSDGSTADVLHRTLVRDPDVAVRLRSEMLAVMAAVGSDGTHAEMLSRMIAAVPSVDIVSMALQSAAATIGSDGVMADFILRTLDRVPQLVADGPTREALDRAVRTIGNDRLEARVTAGLAGLP